MQSFLYGLVTALSLASGISSSTALAADCREESLVRFVAKGKPVASEVIGKDDPCDDFGGNRAVSPKNQLAIYVNFNIPGIIDLTHLDAAFDAAHPTAKPFLRRISLAVVSEDWLRRVYHSNEDAVLNQAGTSLFISERVLRENRVNAFWDEFYGLSNEVTRD